MTKEMNLHEIYELRSRIIDGGEFSEEELRNAIENIQASRAEAIAEWRAKPWARRTYLRCRSWWSYHEEKLLDRLYYWWKSRK